MKDLLMKGFISLLFISLILGACSYLNRMAGLEDDHPIEELVEEVIESKIGLDIDLTPSDK